ncbi:MAG: HPr family phosphocarrier protein [Oscillospiraceae bacterium]|nr:HPr family phosphocarrier protein [Oscillospiraceae bacterium]
MYIKEADVMDTWFPKNPGAILQKAYEFESDIWIEVNEQRENAKILLDILKLHIRSGTHITIITDGSDEVEAADAIADLVTNDYYNDIW